MNISLEWEKSSSDLEIVTGDLGENDGLPEGKETLGMECIQKFALIITLQIGTTWESYHIEHFPLELCILCHLLDSTLTLWKKNSQANSF